MHRILLSVLVIMGMVGAVECALGQPGETPKITLADSLGIKWVFIPGDTLEMGDVFGDGEGDEKPVHTVSLSDYYLSATEVTFAQYDVFCEATGRTKPSDSGWGLGNRPVIKVNTNDAAAYCEWLFRETGLSVRLPTEAEWEYAARSGEKREKWAGTSSESAVGQYAWTGANSNKQTHPVGTKRPNDLGLYDMSGNVWEWCADWKDEYSSARDDLPPGVVVREVRPGQPIRIVDGQVAYESDGTRVKRGGAWNETLSAARSVNRSSRIPEMRDWDIGFRLARTP